MSLDLKIEFGPDGALPVADHLMYAFGSFRPSDRVMFSEICRRPGGEKLVFDSFHKYMEVWAEADWLEEYNVQRIAIWMSVNAPATLLEQVRQIAQENIQSNNANRAATYSAFLSELEARA